MKYLRSFSIIIYGGFTTKCIQSNQSNSACRGSKLNQFVWFNSFFSFRGRLTFQPLLRCDLRTPFLIFRLWLLCFTQPYDIYYYKSTFSNFISQTILLESFLTFLNDRNIVFDVKYIGKLGHLSIFRTETRKFLHTCVAEVGETEQQPLVTNKAKNTPQT